MSKRKLTRRQAWRIEKIQEEKAKRASKKEALVDDQFIDNEQPLSEEQQGLVVAHYGTQIEVCLVDDVEQSKRCHFRTNLGSLVTGDRVVWRDGEPYGVVEAVLPRQSELSRPDPYGEMKTVAANIDQLFIVIAPIPKPHSFLIDRYLVAAENIGVKPVIVINKEDLVNDDNRQIIKQLEELYQSLHYSVLRLSADKQQGLEELDGLLKDKTSVFVGQSGVGKSSLIHCLLPDIDLKIGAISEANQKGTHTTTTTQLFQFPNGGYLIDSPGIREFGLWHMDEQSLLEGFIEFRPFIGHCKFRNCQHRQEPGCALLEACERGDITAERWASFEALRDEIVEMSR